MWSYSVSCLIVAATCLQIAESQRSFGYEQRFLSHKPLIPNPSRDAYGIGTGIRDPTRLFHSTSDGEKVKIDVYYETNCPDSMRFINRQLYPLYQNMKDIVDIKLVPFGKASETYDSISKKYAFRCHHGPAECYGNTVQICSISMYPKVEDHLEFINCMESYPRPSDSGSKCARRLSMDWKKISKCADGDEGNRLLHEQAQLTKSLNPPLNFVPWININKVYSDLIQRRSLRDLKGVVCEAYKGNHPQCSY